MGFIRLHSRFTKGFRSLDQSDDFSGPLRLKEVPTHRDLPTLNPPDPQGSRHLRPDRLGLLVAHRHLHHSVTWAFSPCASTSPRAQGHLLPGPRRFPCRRRPLPPAAGAGFAHWPWPAVRWEPVGGARPASVPLCGRHSAGASCGSFLNDLQIFLGSHLMFLGLVLFLFIMFHSGMSPCV